MVYTQTNLLRLVVLASAAAYLASGYSRLSVTRYENDPAYIGHPYTTMDKAFQGSGSTSYPDCYVGNMANNGWAKLYFNQEYMIQQLRFLNRNEGGDRMTDIEIDVCRTQTGQCERCATAGYTPLSSWKNVNCPAGGLQGDYVSLINRRNYLQFCEIEIYGSPVPSPPTVAPTAAPVTCPACPEVCPTSCPVTAEMCASSCPVTPDMCAAACPVTPEVCTASCPVATCPTAPPTTTPATTTEPPVCPQFAQSGEIGLVGCESIKVKTDSGSCLGAFDGSMERDVKSGTCFVSQSNKRGWIEVMLDGVTQVGSVVILPKGNGDGLEGAVIEVCVNNQNNCQTLAQVGGVDKSTCSVVSGAPITGNMVRVSIEGSNLVICEMKVYPN